MRALQVSQAQLEALTWASKECRLMAPAWELAAAYTREVALRLRADDWLDWYWLDNRMGESALSAGLGAVSIPHVRTIRHLARIIVAHRDHPTHPAQATALSRTVRPSPR
jgi:hypothetical protein